MNGLNTGKNEKEIQFKINFTVDVTLPRLCKSQVLCQLCSLLIDSVDAMCGDLKPFTHFEREMRESVR